MVPEIRQVSDSESVIEAAAAVLARAFLDEPIFIAAVPDAGDRLRLCPPLFRANLRHACRFGEALTVGEPGGPPLGVAYWVPRPEPRLDETDAADLGYSALAEWSAGLTRLGALEAEAARALERLTEPWRYLGAIGVDPARQGQGLGSMLLARLVADAKAVDEAFGLVTDRQRNVPFYEKAGLAVVAEGATAGFRWWSMATGRPA